MSLLWPVRSLTRCHSAPQEGGLCHSLCLQGHHASPRLTTPHLQGLGVNRSLGRWTENKPSAWGQ